VLVLFAGCPALYAGCPGSPCTPDFRDYLPDVRLVLSRGRFNLMNLPDVWPCAECPGFPDMPDVLSWPPVVWPLYFYLCFCSVLQVARQAGCPAPLPGCPACLFTCTTMTTFVLTLYIALLPHGRGLTIHFEQTLEHISLSLSHSSTPNLRSPRDLRAFERSCPTK
jgi:hypothetical protein